VVYEVLALPFRGLVRSCTVAMPCVPLHPASIGADCRPVVLVDDVPGDQPMVLAATTRGNRLCWNEHGEWKAFPAPPGRLASATWAGGRVHALVDGVVWSLAEFGGV
jgi:hypothetical protein